MEPTNEFHGCPTTVIGIGGPPVTAVDDAFRLRSTLVVPVLAFSGENDAVTPAGSPDAAKPIGPLEPFNRVMKIEVEDEPPAATASLLSPQVALHASPKSGFAFGSGGSNARLSSVNDPNGPGPWTVKKTIGFSGGVVTESSVAVFEPVSFVCCPILFPEPSSAVSVSLSLPPARTLTY